MFCLAGVLDLGRVDQDMFKSSQVALDYPDYEDTVHYSVKWTTKTNQRKTVELSRFEHYWFEKARDRNGSLLYEFLNKTGQNSGAIWKYKITFDGEGAKQENITTEKTRLCKRQMRGNNDRSRSPPRLLALPAPAHVDLRAAPPPPSRASSSQNTTGLMPGLESSDEELWKRVCPECSEGVWKTPENDME